MASCAGCLKDNASQRCSQCRCMFYCNKECATKHWRAEHKGECQSIRAKLERCNIVDEKTKALVEKISAAESEDDVCCVCLEKLTASNAVGLPCKHLLCGECVFRLPGRVTANFSGGETFEGPACPQCRVSVPSFQSLIQHLYETVAEMIQSANPMERGSSGRNTLTQFALHQNTILLKFVSQLRSELSADSSVQGVNTCDHLLLHLRILAVDIDLCRGNATECIEKATALLVDWGNKLEELYTINMNIQCGKAHMILSDFPKAIRSFQTALSTVDQNRHTIQAQTCFYELIRCFYEIKAYDLALNAGEAAVAMNKNYDGVYHYIALTHKAMGNLDLAIETMKKAAVYETPWDDKNKAVVRALLNELVEEKNAGGGDQIHQ